MSHKKKDEDYSPALSSSQTRSMIEIYDGLEQTAPYRKDRKIWLTETPSGRIKRSGIILIYKFLLRPPVEAIFQLPEDAVVDIVKATETKPEYYVTDLGCRLHFRDGAKPNEGGLVSGRCEVSVRRCQIYAPIVENAEDLKDEQYLATPEEQLRAISYIDTYNNVSILGSGKAPDCQLVVTRIPVERELKRRKHLKKHGSADTIKTMVSTARKHGAFWATEAPDRRRQCLIFLYPFSG